MKSILKHFNIPLLRRAMNEMKGKKRQFIVYIIGFCAVEAGFITLPTVGLKGAVNVISSRSLSSFWLYILLMALGYLMWWAYAPICTYFSMKISKGIIRSFKTELITHMIRLPMTYHDRKPAGELLSSLSNDSDCFERIYNYYFFQVLHCISGGMGGIVVMAVINWRFAAVVIILGAASVMISSYFSKKLEKVGRTYSEKLAKTSTDAYELVRAAKTIRILGIQNRQRDCFKETAQSEAAIKLKSGETQAQMKAAVKLTDTLCYLVILFAGAVFVHYKLSDWGTVIALLGLKTSTDMLFVECPQYMAEMQVKLAGVKRVYEIIDTPEENLATAAGKSEAVLELNNVSFEYETGGFLLKNFSLLIWPRSLTVMAGMSGSGKSTVMKLILGLYEPSGGEIHTSLGSNLRKVCDYVPQEASLFRGTVYENIAFGRPEATKDEVYKAAELAGVAEFISALPEGFDTPLLDCGASFSGGQKQRIAIARAILRDSPVLLLDEITSALDSETEMQIFETVRELSKTKSVLFITHNKELMELADRAVMI